MVIDVDGEFVVIGGCFILYGDPQDFLFGIGEFAFEMFDIQDGIFLEDVFSDFGVVYSITEVSWYDEGEYSVVV